MRFGTIPLVEALGAIAAHSVKGEGFSVRKGTVITQAHIAALAAAGVTELMAARLDAGDMSEDAAAGRLAQALAGPHVRVEAPFTGRANLFAVSAGVLEVDAAAVDAFNAVDEAITLATLPAGKAVAAGEMVATVKIIPFAVDAALVDDAAATAAAARVSLAPYGLTRAAVISTRLPGLDDKVVRKTLKVTADRLAGAGAAIVATREVPHDAATLAQALRDVAGQAEEDGAQIVIVFGASAIADRRDVIPAAVEAAGGVVERLGMPVDPGNLLMLGRIGDVPVLGAPGCARSPRENGFDFILARLLAGRPVTSRDISAMGVGGLIGEIAARPQPRAEPVAAPSAPVAALVLAAGRGTRMGTGVNKLLAEIGGVPVVRRVVAAALASRAGPVVVVTGHERARVEAALEGLAVTFIHNEAYAQGMATSLRTGIAALPADVAGAFVMLGDMPLVDAALVDLLLEAFAPESGRLIAVPTVEGRRGHPVLFGRRFFPELKALEGDVGARQVLAQYEASIVDVPVAGSGALMDVDTPELLASAREMAGE